MNLPAPRFAASIPSRTHHRWRHSRSLNIHGYECGGLPNAPERLRSDGRASECDTACSLWQLEDDRTVGGAIGKDSMTQSPTVSIIVPKRNRSGVLSDCLITLVKQDYPVDRYQVVVVDDGSEERQ